MVTGEQRKGWGKGGRMGRDWYIGGLGIGKLGNREFVGRGDSGAFGSLREHLER